jgi:UDP-N-acetylmuramate dehydrogenase
MFEKFLKENDIVFKTKYDFGSTHGYKTPGLVDYYIEIDSVSKLQLVLKSVLKDNLDIMPVGEGTNLLIEDVFKGVMVNWKGSGCTVVSKELPGKEMTSKSLIKDEALNDISSKVFLKVESGTTKSDLTEYCVKNGLSGLEFWAGIPGLVGGGLAMNSGAYDKDMKDLVASIELLTVDGVKNIEAKDLKWSYRKLKLVKPSVIISAVFVLDKKEPEQIKVKVDEYVSDREKKHPLEYPSCGSVFKNPSCDKGAWFLIKDAGLSGLKIGGAMVSPKHTNFIINAGGAKAKDVIELIRSIKEKVKAKFGIELEEELRVIKNK